MGCFFSTAFFCVSLSLSPTLSLSLSVSVSLSLSVSLPLSVLSQSRTHLPIQSTTEVLRRILAARASIATSLRGNIAGREAALSLVWV